MDHSRGGIAGWITECRTDRKVERGHSLPAMALVVRAGVRSIAVTLHNRQVDALARPRAQLDRHAIRWQHGHRSGIEIRITRLLSEFVDKRLSGLPIACGDLGDALHPQRSPVIGVQRAI